MKRKGKIPQKQNLISIFPIFGSNRVVKCEKKKEKNL